MRKVLLFGEDFACRKVVGTLVERIARDNAIDARLEWKCATGGHGRVVQEFRHYLRSVHPGTGSHPDPLIVATDVTCKGVQERGKEFQALKSVRPRLGGVELAEEPVCRIDLGRAMRPDRSFRRFVANLTTEFRRWK